MNLRTLIISLLIVVNIVDYAEAQTASQDRVLYVTKTAVSKNSISFDWSSSGTTSTTIYRKLKRRNVWSRIASGVEDSTYTDSRFRANTEYEYKFEATSSSYSGTQYGYISAGFEVEQVTSRGDILVVLDSRLSSGLSVQMEELTKDLISDRWNPIVIEHSSQGNVSSLKIRIDSVHNIVALDAVYLIGHLPVPYRTHRPSRCLAHRSILRNSRFRLD